jgi:GDPmannose 4,6-dehydratase
VREVGVGELRGDEEGEGIDEKGIDADSGRILIEVDPRYFRPTEVDTLLGDSTKAREKLGWVPEISLDEMVAEMVREDLKLARRDELCKREGFRTFDFNE